MDYRPVSPGGRQTTSAPAPVGRRFREAFGFLGDCAAVTTRADFVTVMLPGLHRLMRVDEVSYAEIDLKRSSLTRAEGYPTRLAEVPVAARLFLSAPTQHPWVAHYRRRQDPSATRLSEVMPHSELLRTRYFAEFYRPRGIRFADSCAVSVEGSRFVGLSLNRTNADFADWEHELFERLRRPLEGLWHQVGEREDLVRALAVVSALAAVEATADVRTDALTVTEARVVGLILEGLPNRAIATVLGVSTKAVEQHLTRVYRRLGVSSRSQLIVLLRRSSAEKVGEFTAVP